MDGSFFTVTLDLFLACYSTLILGEVLSSEYIKVACEEALSLSSCVTDELLRVEAFGVILQHILGSPRGAGGSSQNTAPSLDRRPKRKPGLKSRLEELIESKFFSESKSLSDVTMALKTAGWNHKSKEISARLVELTQAKRLRRNQSQDGLRYSNW
jgi:hypothetical protein